MQTLTLIVLCLSALSVNCSKYNNVTLEPASRQLYDFSQEHPKTIGLWTTSSGEPVEIRDTLLLNSDQFASQDHLDRLTNFVAERIPERVVHAKGTGAFGYFIVTNDVSEYTSAELFNRVGKKTPVLGRFSIGIESVGGTDVSAGLKGLAVKFYTKEGNLDLLGLQTPIYFYKDPINFLPFIHSFKRNPKTHLRDSTAIWDFITLRPEFLHNFLWIQSNFGTPNGYRRMDAFPIHTYELNNKNGEKHYVRFNFRTELGLDNLTIAEQAEIQGRDLDYYIRDLYNAIERKQYPSWRLEIDILTVEDIKKLDYDPFDVTRLWKNGTYTTMQIGRIIFDRIPDNIFASVEHSAFNPGNLVPGIPGPVDGMFKGRRLFYRDTQNYRLGTNHNKILVNKPNYAKTYVRDGRPPLEKNMKDVPNYYPNSYSGPMPYVDETRPEETLLVLERNSVDLQPSADFYNYVLPNDVERQSLIDRLVQSLVPVTPPVQRRAVKFLYLIDTDLGKRVEIGLKAALIVARANQSG